MILGEIVGVTLLPQNVSRSESLNDSLMGQLLGFWKRSSSADSAERGLKRTVEQRKEIIDNPHGWQHLGNWSGAQILEASSTPSSASRGKSSFGTSTYGFRAIEAQGSGCENNAPDKQERATTEATPQESRKQHDARADQAIEVCQPMFPLRSVVICDRRGYEGGNKRKGAIVGITPPTSR